MEINGLTTQEAFTIIENAMVKINEDEDANCIFFGSAKDSGKGFGYINLNGVGNGKATGGKDRRYEIK